MFSILIGLVTALAFLAITLQLSFSRRKKISAQPVWTFTRGIICIGVIVFSCYSIHKTLAVRPDSEITVLGLLIIVAGLLLRIWAQLTLGQSWSVGVQLAQSLVTNGPYQFLRHPMYDAYFIIGIGTVVITQNLALASLWVFFWILLFQRAFAESKLLDQNYPEFKTWSVGKWMLFPPIYLTIRQSSDGA